MACRLTTARMEILRRISFKHHLKLELNELKCEGAKEAAEPPQKELDPIGTRTAGKFSLRDNNKFHSDFLILCYQLKIVNCQ